MDDVPGTLLGLSVVMSLSPVPLWLGFRWLRRAADWGVS